MSQAPRGKNDWIRNHYEKAILLVALLAGRTALRGFLETHAAGWHVDAAVFTDAFLLFAVGLIVAQRLGRTRRHPGPAGDLR